MYQQHSQYVTNIDIPLVYNESLGYHVSCYSAYTSFSNKNVTSTKKASKGEEVTKQASKTLRSSTVSSVASTSGIFEKDALYADL